MVDEPRQKLPNRRPCVTRVLETLTDRYYLSFGLDPHTGEIREVFIRGAKIGSDMEALLDDASVLMSLALQHGLPLPQLQHSLNAGRQEAGKSILAGAVRLMEEERQNLRT